MKDNFSIKEDVRWSEDDTALSENAKNILTLSFPNIQMGHLANPLCTQNTFYLRKIYFLD